MDKFESVFGLFKANRFYFDRTTDRCSFRVFADDGRRYACFGRHFHREIELIYIEEGAMHVTAMDEHLIVSAGDLLIFNPFTVHSGYVDDMLPTVSYTYARFDVGQFSLAFANGAADMAAKWDKALVLADKHRSGCQDNERIGAHIANMVRLYGDSSHDTAYEAVSEIYALLAILQSGGYLTQSGKNSDSGHFVEKAAMFLEQNYQRDITPELIYEKFPYSRSYFCRLWKRHFGVTFSTSLNEYRIHAAISRYIDKPDCTLSIGEIAQKVGFTDYCLFSHTFRKIIGCSPCSYRKLPKSQEEAR